MKSFFRKSILTFIFVLLSIVAVDVLAQENREVDIFLFTSSGCPHCAEEKEFLAELSEEKPNIVVHEYEISKNRTNAILLGELGKYLGVEVRGVPFTVIGENYYSGFGSASTTGEVFREAVSRVETGEEEQIMESFFADLLDEERAEAVIVGPQEASQQEEPRPEEMVDSPESAEIEETTRVKDTSKPKAKFNVPEKLDLPLFGKVDTKTVSLPVLTFVIALVDGFNPCAMWVLLFLISLLLGFRDRKRMWILGLTFIASSAFVYFLFMAAWLNFFLFVGFLTWVRILVGLLALFFAYKNIRAFIEGEDGCEVTQDEKRVQTLQRIKNVTQDKRLLPAMFGMVLLAFAVNLIEAICSAGLPAIYTQILALSELPTWKYYSYIIFYQIIFMLDDMAIFVIAMVTMQAVGVESKYARWVKIFGGLVMLVLGILLIFKPEWLLFG
jgi:glutaredoxin